MINSQIGDCLTVVFTSRFNGFNNLAWVYRDPIDFVGGATNFGYILLW